MTTTVNGGPTAAKTGTRSRKTRAARAAAVIEELTQQRLSLPQLAPGASAGERRDGQLRRALIAARLAGWWRVLARTTTWAEVPEVFATAAYMARYTELDRAKESLERARYWADRAAAAGQASMSGPVR